MLSSALKQESDTIVAALMAASATGADRLYILTASRGEVQAHLTQAEQIEAALNP